MGKSRDRANRSGSDPINIGAARLSLDSAASSDIKVTAQDGTTLKKVFAEELHVGTGNDRVILKRNSSDGKVQFQTTDGSTTTDTQVGTGVVTNPGDLPLTGNSAGDTKFVTSNNNLMIYNGTGWYKIATVTNSSPTISSAGNASYSFATDGTPIVIEIAATDPEGLALQYKYQVTSGSLGSTATVTSSSTSGGTYSAINANTLTSNKYFKVTPSTDTAHAGTFSLTFSASDGINVANSSASSFTLQFSTYGSQFFDGVDDWLTNPTSSDLLFGTNDFTIEYWLNPYYGANTSNYTILFSLNCSTSGKRLEVAFHGSGPTIQVYTDTGAWRDTHYSPPTNEWTHMAFVRDSSANTLKMYANGVQQWSVSNTRDYNEAMSLQIGSYGSSSYGDYKGYLSNFRIVAGADTAVYTSNFTVPTSPLTAITGTKLLTFTRSEPEIITTGSTYFDGTADDLTVASSSDFALGTGDFTIECWVKFSDTSIESGTNRRIFALDTGGNVANKLSIAMDDGSYRTNGDLFLWSNSDQGNLGLDIRHNWHHKAVVRNSGTLKFYLDGIEKFSASNSNDYSTSDGSPTPVIGQRGDDKGYYNGYISNFRLVVGTAVYTSNFTVPTSPLTAITGTKLLTCQNNTGAITDASSSNHTITTNGDAIATYYGVERTIVDESTSLGHQYIAINDNVSQSAYNPFPIDTAGYGSLYFDGSGDHAIAEGSNLVVGTNDFTIEYWVKRVALSFSSVGTIFDMRKDHNTSIMNNISTNGEVRLYANSGYRITANPPMNENEWNHVAIQRTSNTTKMYLNGIEQTTTYSDTNNYTGDKIYFGSERDTTTEMTGYISNFRQVIGSNVYTPSALSGWSGSIHMNGGTLSSNGISGSYTMGTGDFTIETWFKYTASATLGSNDYLFDLGTSNDIRITFGAGKINVDDGGQVFSYDLHSTIDTARWYHLAYTRTGNISSLYLDGQLKASIGSSNYNHAETTFTLGNYGGGGSYVWSGYLTDFRIVKGKAVYTGNFTRPSGPLTKTGGTYPSSTNISNPAASQTVLLIGNNASSITDVSDTGHTLTTSGSISASSDVPTGNSITVPTSPLTAVTNTKLLTAQLPPIAVTSGSIHLDGGNLAATSSDFALGTGDYTIETWFRYTVSSSLADNDYILDLGSNKFQMWFAGGEIVARIGGSNTYSVYYDLVADLPGNLNTNRFYHLALVRNGSDTTMFLDGIQKANTNSTAFDLDGTTLTIGSHNSGVNPWYGYLTDIRIVKGKAVYTGAFTPPSGPLTKTGGTYPSSTNISNPTASETVLLIGNNSSSITDVSDSGHTFTSTGTSSASAVVPTRIATDQSSNNYYIAANGDTRTARNWPFNYSG